MDSALPTPGYIPSAPGLPTLDLPFRFWPRNTSQPHGLQYLGPTLRGAFGHALKAVACRAGPPVCQGCDRPEGCAVPWLFDGRPPRAGTLFSESGAVPPPFLLVVPGPSEAKPAGPVAFTLRLLGPAAAAEAGVCVQAVERMASAGLGSGRARFDTEPGEPVHRTLPMPAPALEPPDTTTELRFNLQTPLLLRVNGRPLRQLRGLDLVLAGRRRFRGLVCAHGSPPGGDWPAEPRVEEKAFETTHSDLRRWSIRRTSSRQRRVVPMEGLLGEVTIRGPWAAAGPWLDHAPLLHVGKAAAFGFGRMQWEAVTRPAPTA